MTPLSTHGVSSDDRSARWSEIISQTYFPLQLDFRDPAAFKGRLSHRAFGDVSLSRLTSDPVSYTRHGRQIREDQAEDYLITIPLRSPVEFRQLGRDVRCDPGGFIIERGDEPYRFRYEHPNDLFVLKISQAELGTRVRRPDRLCARVFDATNGTARLFSSMVALAQDTDGSVASSAQDALGRQLLMFLSMAVDNGDADAAENVSAVRAAHLARIDRFIRNNIKAADLSPEMIAARCGISKRYLHDLFRSANMTRAQKVRDYRLTAAHDELACAGQESLSAIAYRFGFADQAQFSRLFKAKFGITPSAFRSDARN